MYLNKEKGREIFSQYFLKFKNVNIYKKYLLKQKLKKTSSLLSVHLKW